MGKIRVTTIGDESIEEAEKKEKEAKRAGKKAQKEASEKAHLPGMEGGSRVKVVGPTEDELEKLDETKKTTIEEAKPQAKTKKSQKNQKSHRSKAYKEKLMEVDRAKIYPLKDAIGLLTKVHLGNFDETVELHINTLSTGISGQMKLPNGTGRDMKVVIADDALISEIEAGRINFDVLIATPAMMPKLAKVAKVLGPRGLMPNPKAGTITDKPEEAAKKYQGGVMNFKTEAKSPIIHLVVGKLSFGDEKLSANIESAIGAVKKMNIKDVTLKSSMSPGIKLKV